jgi:hypothetical protein
MKTRKLLNITIACAGKSRIEPERIMESIVTNCAAKSTCMEEQNKSREVYAGSKTNNREVRAKGQCYGRQE